MRLHRKSRGAVGCFPGLPARRRYSAGAAGRESRARRVRGRPITPPRSRITGRQVEEPARGLLTTPIEDEQHFTDIVVDLASRGIPVTEIALKLPSLDEVFFTLTGKGVPEDAQTASEKEPVS